MKRGQRKRHLSQAMVFLILFGIVSLFSDMTHEGASSIRGAYLSIMGASAGAIGFFSGLGELIGYSMRYLFGKLTDKTRQYWPITVHRLYAGCDGSTSAGTGRRTWLDMGLSAAAHPADGQSHQKASQRYDHVLCRISGRSGKELWHSGAAGSDRCVPGTGAAVSGDALSH